MMRDVRKIDEQSEVQTTDVQTTAPDRAQVGTSHVAMRTGIRAGGRYSGMIVPSLPRDPRGWSTGGNYND